MFTCLILALQRSLNIIRQVHRPFSFATKLAEAFLITSSGDQEVRGFHKLAVAQLHGRI